MYAEICVIQQKFQEAESQYREAQELQVKADIGVFGTPEKSPFWADHLRSLSTVLAILGKTAEAEAAYSRAVKCLADQLKQVPPDDIPKSRRGVQERLASADQMLAKRQWNDAVETYWRCLYQMERTDGPHSLTCSDIYDRLAKALTAQSRTAEAQVYSDRAKRIRREQANRQ